MRLAGDVIVGLLLLLHLYIAVLEIFFWDKPVGMRAFKQTVESARATKTLAANQGVYNGFLAAGFAWGLLLGPAGRSVKLFFLCCVLLAGVFGGLTSARKILLVQALPALLGLIAVMLADG